MNSGNEIITKLRTDEKEIQEKLEKMRQPVTELEAVLKNLQGTIAYYEGKANSKTFSISLSDVLSLSSTNAVPKLKGLTHEQAVVVIAKHNSGIVRTQTAKKLMIKAGIMRETKNSTNMAHNAIHRTGKFERVSPGEYRLKTEDQPENNETIRRIVRLPFEATAKPQ
jgi:hypothetical protein